MIGFVLALALAAQVDPANLPGPGTATFAESCKVAAKSLQPLVGETAPEYGWLGEQARYWDDQVRTLAPDTALRTALETQVGTYFSRGLKNLPPRDGMVYLSQHLASCRQVREANP